MQGFRFLSLDSNGTPSNHGVILEAITPERYLCQFARNPPFSRVMPLQIVEGWHLFPNDEAMNAFITAIHKEQAADKKPTKKTTRKKTNVKK